MRSLVFCFIALLGLCGCGQNVQEAENFGTRPVTMPDGRTLRAENAVTQEELIKGLMFRPSLAKDHGMLLIHNKLGRYPMFMYNMQIPLDIIWVDSQKRVVEVAAQLPPCKEAKASQCPFFGGRENAQFVLLMATGQAEQYKLKVGSTIDF